MNSRFIDCRRVQDNTHLIAYCHLGHEGWEGIHPMANLYDVMESESMAIKILLKISQLKLPYKSVGISKNLSIEHERTYEAQPFKTVIDKYGLIVLTFYFRHSNTPDLFKDVEEFHANMNYYRKIPITLNTLNKMSEEEILIIARDFDV